MSTNQEGDGLSSRGRAFEQLFLRAWRLFQEDDTEESERISRMLLTHADLGDFHKAGCHLILSHGKDNYLHHAEQAVDLYENMFVVRRGSSYDGSQEPTPAQRQFVEKCLEQARKGLTQARIDHEEVEADYAEQVQRFRNAYGRDATNEELVAAHHSPARAERDAHFDAVDAALDQFHQEAAAAEQRAAEGVVEVDDEDDNDEKMDAELGMFIDRVDAALGGALPTRVPGDSSDTPAPTSDAAAPPPTSDAAAPPSTHDPATAPPTSDPAGP